MLSKNNRADKKAVDQIFKEGRFVNSTNLTLKFINLLQKNTHPRISFIVPKTVSKKAVVRNLLRRRGYAVLRKYFKQFPSGFLGVFIFNKKGGEVFSGRKNKNKNPIKELENEIKLILNKLNY
ncbi:MAG: ribonuclease P protein component [Minisyncoccia bacterium]